MMSVQQRGISLVPKKYFHFEHGIDCNHELHLRLKLSSVQFARILTMVLIAIMGCI